MERDQVNLFPAQPATQLNNENLINNWNAEFPSYPLTIADFKSPQAVMSAILRTFECLGIDGDALLMSLPDEEYNEHTPYYKDLLPVINMTRVINHFFSSLGAQVTMMNFLQPTVVTTRSVLLLSFNLMLFYKERELHIRPYEEELIARSEQVKALEDKKNNLLVMLNEQAEEKGKRAERLEKLDGEIKQLEEELRIEKEAHDVEKQELDAVLKEEHQAEMILEQKKGQRDAIMVEVAKNRALRVYDAEDIKAQAEQAFQNVKEADEKLVSLQETHLQKENYLKNLKTIKPNLDTANNLLHEIMKISESLKEESGDLDSESKDGELDVLNIELAELQAQLSEVKAAREEAAKKRQNNQAKRQQEQMLAQNALRDAEENDRKCRERCNLALQRTQEIKELTAKYESEKAAGMEELDRIKKNFTIQLKSFDDALLQMAKKAEENIEKKLRSRHM